MHHRTLTIAAVGAVAAAVAAAPAHAAPVHTVAPGETLWSIASADGISPAALAAANGLSSEAHVIAGSTLTIPPQEGGSVAPAATASSVSATGESEAPRASGASATPAPAATTSSGGSVTAGDIAGVASANGVPASLATAVAWQESGFQNGIVSSTGARGVMQVEPDTWDYVQRNLAGGRLEHSALGNVNAGTLYLRHLLNQTGDTATAVAGYYQGPASVARIGMLPETRRYVANVLALQRRFGGS